MTPILLTAMRSLQLQVPSLQRSFHVSAVAAKCTAGRYKTTVRRNRPLTYEMAHPPHEIAHKKSWNSWNTSNIVDGNRPSETAIEDVFIRRFMVGTWHNIIATEVIIKRQHNIIRIAAIVKQTLIPRKMYFLLGYTEQFLSYQLHCPVKLELQSISDRKAVIHKYI